MKEKLKNHYLKYGAKTFVVLTVLVLIILDLVNSYYMKLWWAKKDFAQLLVHHSAKINGMSLSDFTADTVSEWVGFYDNAFYFFVFLILANNLFFYFFYLRKKLWAQGYVLFYTLTAALFAVTFIFDGVSMGAGWLVYNLLTVLIYTYLYLGVKVLKEETTLVREKKGR
jgi:hypothetical protein